MAEAGDDSCSSKNNPEESSSGGLIKMRPVESFSTNGTSDLRQVSSVDEEEKKSEVGIAELDNDEEEPRTINESFKLRLLDSKRQLGKQLAF